MTLTFGATISTQMAAVDIFDDSVVEETEFINLTLSSRDSAAILSPATAIVSVEDGDSELTIINLLFRHCNSQQILHKVTGFQCFDRKQGHSVLL